VLGGKERQQQNRGSKMKKEVHKTPWVQGRALLSPVYRRGGREKRRAASTRGDKQGVRMSRERSPRPDEDLLQNDVHQEEDSSLLGGGVYDKKHAIRSLLRRGLNCKGVKEKKRCQQHKLSSTGQDQEKEDHKGRSSEGKRTIVGKGGGEHQGLGERGTPCFFVKIKREKPSGPSTQTRERSKHIEGGFLKKEIARYLGDEINGGYEQKQQELGEALLRMTEKGTRTARQNQ